MGSLRKREAGAGRAASSQKSAGPSNSPDDSIRAKNTKPKPSGLEARLLLWILL